MFLECQQFWEGEVIESRPLTFAASLPTTQLFFRHSFSRVVMVPMVAMLPRAAP